MARCDRAAPPPLSLAQHLRIASATRHVHGLGVRPTVELLLDVARCTGAAGTVLDRLDHFARLTPEVLKAAEGDRIAPTPLRLVPQS